MTERSPDARWTLRLLGGVSLAGPSGPVGGRAAQRRRLALLAVLAGAGDRPVSRDRIVALFWPEADTDRARHLLSDSLYVLRSTLGDDVVLASGDDLRLNPARITSDVRAFEDALDAGDLAGAVARYAGPLFDGAHVSDAPDFERWVDDERARLARRQAVALEQLAESDEGRGDPAGAAEWWRRLCAHEPYNARPALRLAQALAAAGDPAAAVAHLRAHIRRLADELGAPPDPTLLALTERLRRAAVPVVYQESEGRRDDPRPAAAPTAPTAPVAAVTGAAGDELAGGAELGARAVRQPLRWRPRARASWWGALAGVAALAVGLAAAAARRSHGGEVARLDPRAIAVMPFRVGAADSSLRYLRDGMLDLLGAKLTGSTHTVNARVVLRALRAGRAAGSAGSTPADATSPDEDLPPARAVAVARDLGAGRVLLGDVVGGGRGLVTLTGSLMSVGDQAAPRVATVTGPADSIPALVDQLAAQLLALGSDEDALRLATLRATPLPALRAYLDAQSAFRRGEFETAVADYQAALRTDSTFALAGLQLSFVAGWIRDVDAAVAGRRAALRARDRLSARDRALLDAAVGPHFPLLPTLREQITLAERAADAARDDALTWYFLGDMLFHFGDVTGVPDSRRRALAAFERGLALDSSFLFAFKHLYHLHAARGDTAAARRTVALYLSLDSTSEISYHAVRFFAGVTLGDSARLREWRAYSAPSQRLLDVPTFWAVESGQGLDEAERVLTILREHSATEADRRRTWTDERVFALARGQPARAARAYEQFQPVRAGTTDPGLLAAQWAALEAVLGDGDLALGARARRALAGGTEASLAPGSLFAAAFYDLAHGDAAAARRAVPLLRAQAASTPAASPSRDIGAGAAELALFLDAELAAADRRPDAPAVLARFDSVLRNVQTFDGWFLPAGNLTAARLWERGGDEQRALAAARRRLYYFARNHFQATFLREEGRLAALAGDRAGAIRAYQRYLALRSVPEPALRADVARVRAALARLGG